ncbi:hypothetical protein BEI_1670 [Halomonas beimenensis]|uniref:Uncharacterized protein n=1 Tax=Halomonas beimenensis TaxID=475662 RepID=A0A291P6Z9_9GAMM|nr:hypothetical protein BEI_1670 [Halomonas beimenensis]
MSGDTEFVPFLEKFFCQKRPFLECWARDRLGDFPNLDSRFQFWTSSGDIDFLPILEKSLSIRRPLL